MKYLVLLLIAFNLLSAKADVPFTMGGTLTYKDNFLEFQCIEVFEDESCSRMRLKYKDGKSATFRTINVDKYKKIASKSLRRYRKRNNKEIIFTTSLVCGDISGFWMADLAGLLAFSGCSLVMLSVDAVKLPIVVPFLIGKGLVGTLTPKRFLENLNTLLDPKNLGMRKNISRNSFYSIKNGIEGALNKLNTLSEFEKRENMGKCAVKFVQDKEIQERARIHFTNAIELSMKQELAKINIYPTSTYVKFDFNEKTIDGYHNLFYSLDGRASNSEISVKLINRHTYSGSESSMRVGEANSAHEDRCFIKSGEWDIYIKDINAKTRYGILKNVARFRF